uniref:RNA-directed DNA polymerase n=1 Tax=Hirondellea gigas TaxID=1518452 RepID=A0A2P2I797_9CRUS
MINAAGVLPLPEKVEAINNFTLPSTYSRLRTFNDMVNFYHRFMKNLAQKMQPLNSMLAGKHSKNAIIKWTEEAKASFENVKEALAEATLLHYPQSNAETSIAVDASDTAVGGVLQQRHAGEWKPIAFFSKKLQPHKNKFSTFGRELLATYLALKHFRYFIEGARCHILTDHILTDHKPLVGAITKANERDIARETLQLSLISQYTTDIRHLARRENIVADTL